VKKGGGPQILEKEVGNKADGLRFFFEGKAEPILGNSKKKDQPPFGKDN